jgi:hypothetical protein
MTRLFILIAGLAAGSAFLVPFASAGTSSGFDSAHRVTHTTLFANGQLVECSRNPFGDSHSIRVGFPSFMSGPIGHRVYFTVVLEAYNGSRWVNYSSRQPWFYNDVTTQALQPVWRVLGTNLYRRETVGWTVPSGSYRLDLNYFWGYDGHVAVYQTNSCTLA